MARANKPKPVLTRMFAGRAKRDVRGKRFQMLQRIGREGPASPLEKLNPFKRARGGYDSERLRRQRVFTDQYRVQRDQLAHKRRLERRKLDEQLREDREDLRRRFRHFYKVGRGDSKNPAWAKIEEAVRKEFKKVKRQRERAFRDQWQGQLHALQMQRERSKRQVTREMNLEVRKAMGKPVKKKYPWEI